METPTLQDIELVSDGWIKKYLITYRMEDGSIHPYEVASRKSPEQFQAHLSDNAKGIVPLAADAVCIVARTSNDTLIMQKEFRYPLNSWCIAFPAGLVDPGEDILACADRELREETGFAIKSGTAARILPQAGYSSTGMSDESVQIVFVEAERVGEAHTEKNELIEVFELPIADIPSFLETNKLPIGTRAQLVLNGFLGQ